MATRSLDVVILGGGNAGMGVTVATREAEHRDRRSNDAPVLIRRPEATPASNPGAVGGR